MSDTVKKENYLVQAWLVLLLSIFFGASLAGVQVLLQDKINSNKLSETLSQIPALVPGADRGEKIDFESREIYQVFKAENQIGWVVPAKGMGFADAIELLIGLDKQASKITGLYILDQKETPGLGNKIVENDFRSQFTNKQTKDPLKVIKSSNAGGNEISAITGATISTDSVCNIVNGTLGSLKDKLAANINKETF